MYIIHFNLECKMICTFQKIHFPKCVKRIYKNFPQNAVMSIKISQLDPRVRFPPKSDKPL